MNQTYMHHASKIRGVWPTFLKKKSFLNALLCFLGLLVTYSNGFRAPLKQLQAFASKAAKRLKWLAKTNLLK